MGFEELASELHKGADAEGRKLLHAAEKNSEKIVADAKEKADEIVRNAKKDAADFANQESAERLTSAKLAAKKIVDEARDEAVEASILQVWQKYKSDSMKKGYPALLEALAKQGMAELGVSKAIVYIRDEDRMSLRGYSTKRLPAEYSGGVIVESEDGKVRTNKTLEELFAQKKPALRKEIYDRLF